MDEFLTISQMQELERKLTEDGYGSIDEWMRDSDYLLVDIEGEDVWVDLDDNPVGDPWIIYFWAKEAEQEAIREGY